MIEKDPIQMIQENPILGWFLLCFIFFIVVMGAIIIVSIAVASEKSEKKEAIRRQQQRFNKIKELESKARKGDLIAMQQWKEMTGRTQVQQESSFFFFWWS